MNRPKLKADKGEAVRGANLTLDFDAPLVSPETFKEAVCAFVDLIEQVSAEVGGAGKKVKWGIQVASGSQLFIAKPVANIETVRSGEETIKAITGGIRLLERGVKFNPPYFNERALRAAMSLASLSKGKTKKVTYLRLKSGGKTCNLTERAMASAKLLLAGQRQAYGAVEGRLSTLSDHAGNVQFVVFDDLHNKGVNCFLGNEKLTQKAIQHFRKRVIVNGPIQYDKDGRAVSIRVEDLRALKQPRDLPGIDDLYDIFNKAG